jgi:3-oxoacyl-[acyl-carrier protein] reductase
MANSVSQNTSDLPPQTLTNKVALVTGASRGLGAEFALDLARRGAKVIITYTSSSSTPLVEELVQKIKSLPNHASSTSQSTSQGPAASTVQVDLRSLDAPGIIVEHLVQNYGEGSMSILVNNAGCEVNQPLAEASADAFASVYDLNVRAPLLLTSTLLPHLKHPARIINIGSVASRSPFQTLGLYCSSKAALEGLTRVWAAELGENGTTVNCVNPGPVESEMLKNVPYEIVKGQMTSTPVERRIGRAEEVAEVVGWLAGDGSKWVSGQCLSVSGGWAMY